MVIKNEKIFLIIIIFFVLLCNPKGKKEAGPGIYYVEMDNLTFDNIEQKIEDQIIAIEPLISPVYDECIIIKYETNNKTMDRTRKILDKKNIKNTNKIKRIIIYSSIKLDTKYTKYKKFNKLNCKD